MYTFSNLPIECIDSMGEPIECICHGRKSNLVEFQILQVESPIGLSTKINLVETPIGLSTGRNSNQGD